MPSKVRIGSLYRPHRYEHRTPTEYRALRPAMDADATRVQAALLPSQRDPDRLVGAALVVACAVVAVLLTTGVI